MNSYLLAPGIRFDEYVFSEPARLADMALPQCGGVVAVLVKDPSWAPKPFQPLCFRDFGNNSDDCCRQLRASRLSHAEMLYFAVLPMPFSTAGQRVEVRNKLAAAYNPVCQSAGAGTHSGELAQKLAELERRHEEQTAQIRLLLETLNRFFAPQPEPLRRPIGFQPPADSETAPRAGL
jgi:hypothetical protein